MIASQLKDYRIYPALGNHDTFPQDIISMFQPRDNPTINDWDDAWVQFIPDQEQQKNFLDYGFYSLPLQDKAGNQIGNNKTKIIHINNNICYSLNWRSVLVYKDPGNML